MVFRFLALGENFPLVQDGERIMMGWFKTLWVDAANLAEAKSYALKVIGTELLEAGLETTQWSKISWDEIEKIEEVECPETPKGFTFFKIEN